MPVEEVFDNITKRVPRFLSYVEGLKKVQASPTEDPKDEDFDDPIDLES